MHEISCFRSQDGTWNCLPQCTYARAARISELETQLKQSREKYDDLVSVVSSPQLEDFLESVKIEAVYQTHRWGNDHDAGKSPADWFWLLGYLSGKALAAAVKGDTQKALHHTISSAACLLNWHAHLSGARTKMRPGTGEQSGS